MKEDSTHNYEYEVDLNGNTAPARVVRMVGNKKRVLEIGAGPGSITKHLQAAGDCKVVALEIDEDAIARLTPYCEKVYQADLNDTSWPDLLSEDGKFDVIVAADVLEHVYDPWNTLALMMGLLEEGGNIVISLPHVGHSAVAACLLDEDFDYRDWGLLDRTHIRFFGLKNMQSLFNKSGLHIKEAQFVIVDPEDSEFSVKWKRLPSDVKKALSSFKHGNIYQVVIKAAPAAQMTKNIDLMELPIDMSSSIRESGVRTLAKKIIPEKYRGKVRVFARKLGILDKDS